MGRKCMKELLRKKFKKVFSEKEWSFSFDITRDGLYVIEVTARVHSWWQNFKRLRIWPHDDDLALGVDEIVLRKQGGARGLFDSEAAFNGNNLRGLQKTVLILMRLKQGQHTLRFFADKTPTLETLAVYELQNHERTFSYVPPDNYPIEDGDRRSWLTMVLVNQGVQSLRIKAAASQGQRDDEDLKLMINGEVQENLEPTAHTHWFWCGRVLKGHNKVFEKTLDAAPAFHYVELWADKSPTIQEITIILGGLPRVPTVDDPEWTGNFRDDPNDILLARLIFGEARSEPREAQLWIAGSVLNRVKAPAWPDTIHDVILQKGQFDPFKEKDKNFPYMKNPFKDNTADDIRAWREAYEIARDMLASTIPNPTEATHFHGIGTSQGWFMKKVVPRGRFLRKIGHTYFYWSRN